MLPKKNRLHKDFDYIYKHGYKVRGQYGMLIAIEDSTLSNPLFGFVVPKKVGKANERNFLKRRLRYIIRNLLYKGVLKEAKLKYVYITFSSPKEFLDLEKEILDQLDKVFKNLKK